MGVPLNRTLARSFANRFTRAQIVDLLNANVDKVLAGDGALQASSVNGSSFSFLANSQISARELCEVLQFTLDFMDRGYHGPVIETTPIFMS
jgi:hypothetical protein